MSQTTLALFGTLGTTEVIVLALLGLLIFGNRLPEVGRSLGKGIIEFKKGLQGIDDDARQTPSRPPTTPPPDHRQIESQQSNSAAWPSSSTQATQHPSEKKPS